MIQTATGKIKREMIELRLAKIEAVKSQAEVEVTKLLQEICWLEGWPDDAQITVDGADGAVCWWTDDHGEFIRRRISKKYAKALREAGFAFGS